jgi:hypothetical protein
MLDMTAKSGLLLSNFGSFSRHPRPDQRVPAGAAEQALLVRVSGLHGVQVPPPAQTLPRDHDVSA